MRRTPLAAGLTGLGAALLAASGILWVGSPIPASLETASFNGGPGTPSYERGRALFVTEGCIGCHWHEQAGAPRGSSYGWAVNLSDMENPHTLLHNDIDYLRVWLRDPWVKNQFRVMPNPNLSDDKIEDLLAFLVPGALSPAQR